MKLEDICDTNPTARKMRLAVKRKKVGQKVAEITKGRSEDRRNTASYDSGVNMQNDDSPSPHTGMGGGDDFTS